GVGRERAGGRDRTGGGPGEGAAAVLRRSADPGLDPCHFRDEHGYPPWLRGPAITWPRGNVRGRRLRHGAGSVEALVERVGPPGGRARSRGGGFPRGRRPRLAGKRAIFPDDYPGACPAHVGARVQLARADRWGRRVAGRTAPRAWSAADRLGR